MKQKFGCVRYSAGQGGPSSCRWQYLGSTEKSHVTLICKHKVGEGQDHPGNKPRKTLPGSSWYPKTTDKEDKYPIYQINNSQFNGQPNYFFKSSVPMAQLANDMDQNGPEHPLQGEEAYFDSCHSRCTGYKTLALFVYHMAMHRILRLATMEV